MSNMGLLCCFFLYLFIAVFFFFFKNMNPVILMTLRSLTDPTDTLMAVSGGHRSSEQLSSMVFPSGVRIGLVFLRAEKVLIN